LLRGDPDLHAADHELAEESSGSVDESYAGAMTDAYGLLSCTIQPLASR